MPFVLRDWPEHEEALARYLSRKFVEHRFDLLGSGWIPVHYDSIPRGLQGIVHPGRIIIPQFDSQGEWLRKVVDQRHVERAKAYWRLIQNPGYQAIDWHRDHKSGFRWPATLWHKDAKKLSPRGADLKWPWELARCQHMPQMALFSKQLADWRQPLWFEFRHQVLDFMAANPLGYGVNWSCAMDVGIRAANWLLAYAIFLSHCRAAQQDFEFQSILAQAIYEHGQHILHELEWSADYSNNHYLANVCGLAYIAAFLEPGPEIDRWLAFALQELTSQIGEQFLDDGCNFEGSSSYHRLSAEMVVWTVALFEGLPAERKLRLRQYSPRSPWVMPRLLAPERQAWAKSEALFDDATRAKVQKMSELSEWLHAPDGQHVQIGDNDSGRFFRLQARGKWWELRAAETQYLNLKDYAKNLKSNGLIDLESQYWDEGALDHRGFLAAHSALFSQSRHAETIEHRLLGQVLGANAWPWAKLLETLPESPGDLELRPQHNLPAMVFSSENDLLKGMKIKYFPNFGLLVIRTDPHFFLCLNFSDPGQKGRGGHSHDDKLSFSLFIDGKALALDPGTYLYTPMPEWRDRFRSAEAHNGIALAKPNNKVFEMRIEFEAKLSYRDSIYLLSFYSCNTIEDFMLQIQHNQLALHSSQASNSMYELFSNGYGKLFTSKSLDASIDI